MTGFTPYLNETVCIRDEDLIPNCEIFSDDKTKCVQCNTGYTTIENEGFCFACTDFDENCQECNFIDFCTKCKEGY